MNPSAFSSSSLKKKQHIVFSLYILSPKQKVNTSISFHQSKPPPPPNLFQVYKLIYQPGKWRPNIYENPYHLIVIMASLSNSLLGEKLTTSTKDLITQLQSILLFQQFEQSNRWNKKVQIIFTMRFISQILVWLDS